MKRTILAGVLTVAAILASGGSAKAAGFGPGGLALSFGVKISYWYEAGPCGHSCHGPACLPPGCYAPPVMGGAAPYLAQHPWAYAGPFGQPAGYGEWGGSHGAAGFTGAGYGDMGFGSAGIMPAGYGQGYGYGYGYGY